MSTRPFLLLLCTTALVRGQTTPSAAAEGEHVQHLDRFVVSAGSDARTAFDLAQGTSVLVGDDLRRLGAGTLGETLSGTPGVASTYHGPGASRPIIRGLGGDRVRVLDNGIGPLDASSVSPDHNTAVEPLFASRIEVLRGPSVLLYGSSAVGGAVNVIDNSIPNAPPGKPLAGSVLFRSSGANDELTRSFTTLAGNRRVAIRVNGLRRSTGDLEIPGVARIDAEAPASQVYGVLPNSAHETTSGSIGTTMFGQSGHAGVAVNRYETEYGVPTGDDPPISLRMRRDRLDLSGALTQAFGPFRSGQARLGFGDYAHAEVSGRDTVNTTFTNRAWEGRVDLRHVPAGPLTGTVGAQGSGSDFAAVGEEVVTPPYKATNLAVFAVEEVKISESVRIEFGGRLERQVIRLGTVDPGLPPVPGYTATSHARRRRLGGSVSAGVVTYPAKDWSVAATIAYTERLPTAQELYSHGPHGGTHAYEIGTSSLETEKSLGLDLSVRRRAGRVTGALSAYANRFHDFVFEQELPADAIPEERNEEGLTPYQYVARDALLYGGEAELSVHLIDESRHRLHLDLSADFVRARQRLSREALPRIAPWRGTARLVYNKGPATFGFEVKKVGTQTRTAARESQTPGYVVASADAAYVLGSAKVRAELFARIGNIGNIAAREHTSFLKEFAPLPGRAVSAGLRLDF